MYNYVPVSICGLVSGGTFASFCCCFFAVIILFVLFVFLFAVVFSMLWFFLGVGQGLSLIHI